MYSNVNMGFKLVNVSWSFITKSVNRLSRYGSCNYGLCSVYVCGSHNHVLWNSVMLKPILQKQNQYDCL